ncbi:endonuclease/exonuclease/phosphatase family protein [Alloacidobacterium dinghuense]|uniref:Endonuclease/exonuclease/phosphatase family protein n=1 Tax=Alloacidobacterium dinghuense TaxID=2763107 RepID=A0A7G8BF27_9BACT|nr:endonuclease/exonuclease/phosphatase family protein [Alloacidobacterium dinghuense]QNI31147.1 endonuclease/exonuclease/phosphatase family protein [Alloacidobacterium dinghuense]
MMKFGQARLKASGLPTNDYVSPHAVAGQLFLLLALTLCSNVSAQNKRNADYIRNSQPQLLTYQELMALGEQETVDPALAKKLNTLLTTPFINNEAYFAGTKPLRPDLKGLGPSLRLVEWNIERGISFDEIKLLLTDKQAFIAKVHSEAANNTNTEKANDEVLSAQMDVLQSADVLVLNELDWGMKRSGYRAVVKDLADALKMNWAYGVEFVEVDPKVLGTQSFANVENEAERKELDELFSTDKTRFLGLHGTAILSRYPLRDVKLVPFKYQAYDWYNGEKKYGSVEAGKRKGASLLFGETIVREVRRGGRTNLIATIDVPDLPGQQVTIVATHLENRTTPKGRVEEADELFDMIRPIRNPVIVAGDMNTTGEDGSVLSLKSAALKKINNPAFWATQGIKYATGVGLVMDIASFGFKRTKFQGDPTASGVPLLAANPEQGFFKDLNKDRFDDGTRIDFRGDAELSVNDREGTLGNSNERASKGFVTTFALPRTMGAVGKFRLDWIFVKGYLKEDSAAADSYRFAPGFARTMNEANQALNEPLSDHAAISVDLPITQPALPCSRK